jgi:hypothetical protein
MSDKPTTSELFGFFGIIIGIVLFGVVIGIPIGEAMGTAVVRSQAINHGVAKWIIDPKADEADPVLQFQWIDPQAPK